MIAFPSKVTVTVEVAEVYCQLTSIVSCSRPPIRATPKDEYALDLALKCISVRAALMTK